MKHNTIPNMQPEQQRNCLDQGIFVCYSPNWTMWQNLKIPVHINYPSSQTELELFCWKDLGTCQPVDEQS